MRCRLVGFGSREPLILNLLVSLCFVGGHNIAVPFVVEVASVAVDLRDCNLVLELRVKPFM